MSVKFIHTADWQIGKAFGTIGTDSAVLLKLQRTKTVRKIAELGTNRNADAILVAGDIFESNLVSNETIHGLLHAMEPYKGPWVMIPGNHDPATASSVWDRMQTLGCPENLFVVLEPHPLNLAKGKLTILPAVLQRKHEIEDLTTAWASIVTPRETVRVGLAHGSVDGYLPGQSEAANPIASDCALRAHMDYVALGDWHGTVMISDRTWYSGTPEQDRFKNNDAGNVLFVTISEPGGRPAVKTVSVGEYLWDSMEAYVDGSEALSALEVQLSQLIESSSRHVVKLSLSGTTDFATRERLESLLSKWRARFAWLGEDYEHLHAQPTDADLDRIDTVGFVHTAIDHLRAIHTNPENPNRDIAIDALRLLYQLHTSGKVSA